MVAGEADDRVAGTVRYYRNRRGRVLTPGNTGAEEDAWNAPILGLAAMMLPHDPRAARWRQSEARYELAAFSRPADLTSPALVNGLRVASLKGTNIFDDGTLFNHRHVSPEYMTAVGLNMYGLLTPGITGKPGLRAALWNAKVVYGAFSRMKFVSPPYAAPGGSIYRTGGGIYYPQGYDWGTALAAPYLTLDVLATNLGFGKRFSPRLWAARHLAVQTQMQQRFRDGRTYAGRSTDKGSEYRYLGREQVTAGQLAQAWLSQYLRTNRLLTTTNRSAR
jgi:hypothetical protein